MVKVNLKSAQKEFLKGNKEKAKKICLHLISKKTDSNIFNFLGVIELSNNDYIRSLSYFNKSLKINSSNIKALNNVGKVLIEKQKYFLAIHFLKKALVLENKFIQAYLNIALAYLKIQRFKDSIFYLEKLLVIDKKNFFALNNLGKIFYEMRKYNKSLNYYLMALELNNNNEILHNNLGLLYERKNRFKKSQLHFKQALKIKPNFFDCQFNLSILNLKIGKCNEGINLYDSRFFKREKKVKSLINKEVLKINLNKIKNNKKIYIIAEQGYGDIFQFSRFGLTLKKLGFIVVFIVDDDLYRFFINQKTFDQYIKKSDLNLSQIASNQIIPLLSIPRIFKLNFTDFTSEHAYINSSLDKTKYWLNKIDKNNFNIGVVWLTNNKIAGSDRNIPTNLLNQLSKLKKIKLISLHTKKHLNEMLDNMMDMRNIIYFDNLDDDFKFIDTAGLIENLDLVISIDTSIAHLSASMGKKTWVLLPYHHHWIWSLKTNQSYWYKSVKLFRSKKYNDWNDVIKKVELDLKKIN